MELGAETWKAAVGRACGICGSVAGHGTGSGGSLLSSWSLSYGVARKPGVTPRQFIPDDEQRFGGKVIVYIFRKV